MKIKTVNITDQVVEYLKENIESGKWNIGEKIPSENQMVMELGVSRSSIRSALQYLIGIITTVILILLKHDDLEYLNRDKCSRK